MKVLGAFAAAQLALMPAAGRKSSVALGMTPLPLGSSSQGHACVTSTLICSQYSGFKIHLPGDDQLESHHQVQIDCMESFHQRYTCASPSNLHSTSLTMPGLMLGQAEGHYGFVGLMTVQKANA